MGFIFIGKNVSLTFSPPLIFFHLIILRGLWLIFWSSILHFQINDNKIPSNMLFHSVPATFYDCWCNRKNRKQGYSHRLVWFIKQGYSHRLVWFIKLTFRKTAFQKFDWGIWLRNLIIKYYRYLIDIQCPERPIFHGYSCWGHRREDGGRGVSSIKNYCSLPELWFFKSWFACNNFTVRENLKLRYPEIALCTFLG